MSSRSSDCVVDTVILMYFLMAAQEDLLVEVLGRPIGVPRVVYDPDEGDAPESSRSEMSRSLAYYRAAAADLSADASMRDQAAANAKRLHVIDDLCNGEKLVVMDMTAEEQAVFGATTSPTGCGTYGLMFPLSAGEAACLAIAVHRGVTLVTDDGDALRALKHVNPAHPYQRIRKLLIKANTDALISRQKANDIHRTMTRLGFWDTTLPYPDEP